MQASRLATLVALSLSAMAVSAISLASLNPSNALVKRGCPGGEQLGYRGCVPMTPTNEPTACELACTAGDLLPMGKPTICPQQRRDQYHIVGHTTPIIANWDIKWQMSSIEPNYTPGLTFKVTLLANGDLTLVLDDPTINDYPYYTRQQIKTTPFYFELHAGQHTYYYKVQGQNACHFGPDAKRADMYAHLKTVGVVRQT